MANRLDIELVTRGLFATRAKAQDAVRNGLVTCNGQVAVKPSMPVCPDDLLKVAEGTLRYVSRGGIKLEHAIGVFGISLQGVTMLDIGSSTGGFTDCALQHGAAGIIAVDVGHGQLDPQLAHNPRVELHEGTDFRDMDPTALAGASLAAIDVSFISVTLIIQKIAQLKDLKQAVCLIKPQFECGRRAARHHKGVVLDKCIHQNAITKVAKAFAEAGFSCIGLTPSPIRGGSGNIEYLGLFRRIGIDEIAARKTQPEQTLNPSGMPEPLEQLVPQTIDDAFM